MRDLITLLVRTFHVLELKDDLWMTYGKCQVFEGEMSTSHYYQPSPGRNLLKDLNHENWYQLEG